MKSIPGNEKIDELILQWHQLSQGAEVDQNDLYFRFIAAWIAFNAFYSSREQGPDGDWQQIQAFAERDKTNEHHKSLLDKDSEYLKAVRSLKKDGVFNKKEQRREEIRDVSDFSKVARCVYLVRCNLFHGGKSPVGRPRDKELVEAAYTITIRILERSLGIPRRR